jgi:hypothetical protein
VSLSDEREHGRECRELPGPWRLDAHDEPDGERERGKDDRHVPEEAQVDQERVAEDEEVRQRRGERERAREAQRQKREDEDRGRLKQQHGRDRPGFAARCESLHDGEEVDEQRPRVRESLPAPGANERRVTLERLVRGAQQVRLIAAEIDLALVDCRARVERREERPDRDEEESRRRARSWKLASCLPGDFPRSQRNLS